MSARSNKSGFLAGMTTFAVGAMLFLGGCGRGPQQHTAEDLRSAFEEAGLSVIDSEAVPEHQLRELRAEDGKLFTVDIEEVGEVEVEVLVFDTTEESGQKAQKKAQKEKKGVFLHDNLTLAVWGPVDAEVVVQAFAEVELGRTEVFPESEEYIRNANKASKVRHRAAKEACATKLTNLGTALVLWKNDNNNQVPRARTSGEVFRKLQEDYGLEDRSFSCPGNPVDKVDFDAPEGVGYYIDPDMPPKREPMRAVAADQEPWELNHGGRGVNVLFEDGHVKFIRPGDSGPPDKISNPYIPEDTDIYADTGDPKKHAWIRWER